MSSWQQRLYEAYCGCCIISEAELRSREIDRQIAEDGVRYLSQINVLLLGTPGSGKRTFLTQANILYGKHYGNDELNEFRPTVYGEIIMGMKVLADERRKLRLEWQDPSNQQHEDKILNFQLPQHIDTEKFMSYFESIKRVWLDKAIQDAYDGRGEFQLRKSTEYFLKQLDRVGQLEYLPSKLDVFYAKAARGYGVPTKYELIINSVTFNMIYIGDTGFSRGWLKPPVIENVTAILFLVSSVAYDELVYSCDLFDGIINSRLFAHQSVILLFTKADLLEEKIKHSNIKEYFPEFQGDPQKLEDVQSFIIRMFDDRRRDKSKILKHFFTMAGDMGCIRFLYSAVKEYYIG